MAAMLRSLMVLATILAPLLLVRSFHVASLAAPMLLCTAVVLWLTRAVPLAVTGFLIPVLAVQYDLLPVGEAFEPFGSEILFLFVGSFLIAEAMRKHGVDRRLAHYLLAHPAVSRSPSRLTAVVLLLGYGLSMWISNTATCVMLTPLVLGIISAYEPLLPIKEHKRFSERMLLACGFAPSLGGLATPVGSPVNLVAIEVLRQHGRSVGFLEWISVATPFSLLLLGVLYLILSVRYRLPTVVQAEKGLLERERAALPPVSRSERLVVAVFALTVTLWLLPELAIAFGVSEWGAVLQRYLPASLVSLLGAALLFVLPHDRPSGARLLEVADINRIEWGTILLFGGGLSLGAAIRESTVLIEGTRLLVGSDDRLLVTVAVVLLPLLFSEVASNTASAAAILPLVAAGIVRHAPDTTTVVVLCSAVAASFGFMLPVSTPPNAIIFATNRLPMREMALSGAFLDLAGAALLSAIVYLAQGRGM